MKVDPFTGKCYGFDGEKLRNYRQYGLYVKDDDPRLKPPQRWWRRLFG